MCACWMARGAASVKMKSVPPCPNGVIHLPSPDEPLMSDLQFMQPQSSAKKVKAGCSGRALVQGCFQVCRAFALLMKQLSFGVIRHLPSILSFVLHSLALISDFEAGDLFTRDFGPISPVCIFGGVRNEQERMEDGTGCQARTFARRPTASSTLARELNAEMRIYPCPFRPKPAPGVVTTFASLRSLSKNAQLSSLTFTQR